MSHDDLDNYNVDFDDDDPFGSPKKGEKRKEIGLGIDEEVTVQKRARVPNVKLDEDRLLGPAGIPKLRTRAAGLKLKGKGHEFSDAARLLSFYQLWLDDLFPKARFLDALSMVEKAGHKKKLQVARQEWISQGKPQEQDEDELPAREKTPSGEDFNTLGQTLREKTSSGEILRGQTPAAQNNGDLYAATPRAARVRDEPDEDDLEALMAEADLAAPPRDDDLDALMAQAEEHDAGMLKSGNATVPEENNYADEEEAMQEMEGLW